MKNTFIAYSARFLFFSSPVSFATFMLSQFSSIHVVTVFRWLKCCFRLRETKEPYKPEEERSTKKIDKENARKINVKKEKKRLRKEEKAGIYSYWFFCEAFRFEGFAIKVDVNIRPSSHENTCSELQLLLCSFGCF